MFAAIGEQLREFGLGEQAEAEDGAPKRFDGGRKIVDHRVLGADAEDAGAVLDVFKAGRVNDGVEPAGEAEVGTDTGESAEKRVFEAVPGGVGRIAVEGLGVGFLESDDAAGTGDADGFVEELALGNARRAGDEAEMDQVEGVVGEAGSAGVALLEGGIGRCRGAGVIEEAGVAVEAKDTAGGACEGAEKRGNADRSAAEVEARPAFADSDEAEHVEGIGRHRFALDAEAFDFVLVGFERVITGEGGRG